MNRLRILKTYPQVRALMFQGFFSCHTIFLKNDTFLSYNKNVFNYFEKGYDKGNYLCKKS